MKTICLFIKIGFNMMDGIICCMLVILFFYIDPIFYSLENHAKKIKKLSEEQRKELCDTFNIEFEE